MFHKLRESKGLTLVEMLCATVILLLLVLLLNTGFNMALSNYHSMVLQSETRLLLATLSDALADELRCADKVRTKSDGSLQDYQSGRYGADTQLGVYPTNGEAGYRGQIYARSGPGVNSPEYRILPDGAYGGGNWACGVNRLEITFVATDPTDPTKAINQFTVKLTVQEMNKARNAFVETGIKAETEFTVRCLNPHPQVATASP